MPFTNLCPTVSVLMPDGVLLEIPIEVTATYEKPTRESHDELSDPAGWEVTNVCLDEVALG